MKQETIAAIYHELDELSVPLKQSPELGLMYYRDRLTECRQKQDRISELLVQVNRELSAARCAARALRTSMLVAGEHRITAALKAEIAPFLDTEDTLKYLYQAVRLRRENLRATSSDIRLMVTVIEQQVKLGEVQPPKSREQDIPLPFGDPQEMSFDSEWPEVPEHMRKKKKPAAPLEDDVNWDKIF